MSLLPLIHERPSVRPSACLLAPTVLLCGKQVSLGLLKSAGHDPYCVSSGRAAETTLVLCGNRRGKSSFVLATFT